MSTDNNGGPLPFVDPNPADVGKPTSISYNFPEPQSLDGRTFVEITFKDEEGKEINIFNPKIIKFLYIKGKQKPSIRTSHYNLSTIEESMKRGFDDEVLFRHVANYTGLIRLKEVKTDTSTESSSGNDDNAILNKEYEMVSSLAVSDELSKLHPTDVYSAHQRGKYLSIYKSKQGLLTYDFIEEDTPKTLGKSLKQIDKVADNVLYPGEITIFKPIDGTRLEGTSAEGVRINIEGNVQSAIIGEIFDGEDYEQPNRVVITHVSVVDGQEQPKQTFDAILSNDPGDIENTGFKLELPYAILKTSNNRITATAHFSTVGDLTARIMVPVIIPLRPPSAILPIPAATLDRTTTRTACPIAPVSASTSS